MKDTVYIPKQALLTPKMNCLGQCNSSFYIINVDSEVYVSLKKRSEETSFIWKVSSLTDFMKEFFIFLLVCKLYSVLR